MKRLIAVVLSGILLAAVLVQWHAYRAAAVSPPSGNEIFIHGTPVCIFRQGENVMAKVGHCPGAPSGEDEVPAERPPFHGPPGMQLPPGHPPVDREMTPDGQRTVPI